MIIIIISNDHEAPKKPEDGHNLEALPMSTKDINRKREGMETERDRRLSCSTRNDSKILKGGKNNRRGEEK